MKKKLKILHTMTWLAKGGGVDRNVFLTINGLKEEFEFHFAVGGEIHHNPFIEITGLKFIVCKDLVRPVSPWHDLKALFFFIRLIRREKYDIVHTHETKASLITRVAAYLAGCRYIIYGLHGVTFNDPMSRAKRNFYIQLEKLTVGVSDLIVGVSNEVIQQYHEHNIGKKIPWQVVHSGIDFYSFISTAVTDPGKKNELRRSLHIQPEDIVLINIGRFSFSKAQRFTILTFAELRKKFPRLKLLLVGEGELMNECKALVKKLNLENDVFFYGFCDQVASLLSVADIHLLTSLREGLPRVAVEASLMKVPTAAFDVEGLKEVITHKVSGYIVPTGNLAALAEKTEELIRYPEKRKEFGQRSFEHVSRYWSADLMIRQLKEIYYQSRPS